MLPLLYLWNSKAMYVGPSFETQEHSHNAIQIVVALDGKTKLFVNGEWKEDNCFVLSPNTKHRTSFLGKVAMLYVDAEDSRFKVKSREQIFITKKTLEHLSSCYRSPVGIDEAETIYNNVLGEVGFYEMCADSIDGRINECLHYIDTHTSEPLSMEKICGELKMSESTFSHLFSKEVGIPFRRFLIWKRLKNAVYYFLEENCSLTEAALEAGFSDQSHFTKSFKEIFGVQPSYIFGKKLRLLNSINRIKL